MRVRFRPTWVGWLITMLCTHTHGHAQVPGIGMSDTSALLLLVGFGRMRHVVQLDSPQPGSYQKGDRGSDGKFPATPQLRTFPPQIEADNFDTSQEINWN